MSSTPATAEPELPLAYHRVKRDIQASLGAQWKVGAKLPTIEALARHFSAGRVSTYRAVRELADEGLLVSRRRLGTFVARTGAAVPDEDARPALPLQGKRVLMPVYLRKPNMDAFMAMGLDAIDAALRAAGAEVQHVEHVVRHVEDKRLADLAAQSFPEAHAAVVFNHDTRQRIVPHRGCPLVVVNTAEEMCVRAVSDYDVVMVHGEHGGYLAGLHLRDVGVQIPCFLGVPSGRHGGWTRTSLARFDGFETGWGARIEDPYLLPCRDYSEAEGAMAVPRFLSLNPRPDGIFAITDEIAVGFVTAALSHGLVPGRDYRILGFDGQPRGREVYGGPLTTIDVPLEELARHAVEMLANRLAEPERTVQRIAVTGHLFIGPTTTGRTTS